MLPLDERLERLAKVCRGYATGIHCMPVDITYDQIARTAEIMLRAQWESYARDIEQAVGIVRMSWQEDDEGHQIDPGVLY